MQTELPLDITPAYHLPELPSHPGFGKQCNQCGLCCLAERCPVSVDHFGESSETCPSLEIDDGRFSCGLLTHPFQYIDPDKAVIDKRKYVPLVGDEFEACWIAYFRFLFGPGICDSEFEVELVGINHEKS